MKRLVLFLFVAVLMVGCTATYYDSEGSPVSREKVAQLCSTAMRAHLAEHHYRVFVGCMYPMRDPTVYLRDDWRLEVSDGSVGLFLPYFGGAYYIPYGYGDGLGLVEPLTSYREEPVKGGRHIFTTTRNDFESHQIVLGVFDNATVSLVIGSSEKETISFSGVMKLNDVFTPEDQKANKKRQTTFMKL